MPGKPLGYVLATLAATFISICIFGLTGTLFGGFLFDIGYSVDPIIIGNKTAGIAAILTFMAVATVSYRDYHFDPKTQKK